MKQISIFCIIALLAPSAFAQDYGYYDEDFDSYETVDSSDVHDLNPDSDETDLCDCRCDCNKNSGTSYSGFRLYKNEHSAYSYHHPNGHKEQYITDNFSFGSVFGNKLTNWARVEYETLYMGKKYTKNDRKFDYDIWANFLNLYFFKEYDYVISPYIGFGVGLSAIWGEMNNQLDSALDASYQAMFGIVLELNKHISLDLGCKYVNFGKVKYEYGTGKIDATQVYLGASYKFSIF